MSSDLDLMNAALAAAEHGWHVFPLVIDGKAPAIKQWEQRATTDERRIRRCWSAGAWNIGIATGPSDLAVIDLDMPKPGQSAPEAWRGCDSGWNVLTRIMRHAQADMPVTYTVRTGRGGTHLYYQHPDSGAQLRNTAGTLGWLVDTRSHGGYVVAAGSVVNGNPYTTTLDVPTVPLPAWLTTMLQPAPLPVQAPVTITLSADRHGRYVRAAIDAQLRHIAESTSGQHNSAVYASAVALGQLVAGGALNEQEIEGLLTQAALGIGQTPAEAASTIRSGMRTGARRPRSVTV